ncbi:hypothetical protein BJV74DRAFT_796013 [Russula compacta]|nr:hypothetical protein BJV74DRAFT_796013 [Russula compacta]
MGNRKSPSASPSTILRTKLTVAKADQAIKRKKAATKAASTHALKENRPTGKRVATFVWVKKENHHLTSELLTLIEDSTVYKVSFGFHKGDAGTVNSGGKKSKDHHLTIAKKLFIDSADLKWGADDLPQLNFVLLNCFTGRLKMAYTKHCSEMSEMGQGLLDNDQADEMTPGSDMKNIWDKILAVFPWYMQMHVLMGLSPIVMRAAVAHSTTPINLDVLNQNGPELPAPKSTSAFGPALSQKHKSLADAVADIAGSEHVNHHKIAVSQLKEKTVHYVEHEKVKQKANVEIKLAHLKHQHQEAAAQ